MPFDLVPAISPPVPGEALIRWTAGMVVAAAIALFLIGHVTFWFSVGLRISG